MDAKQANSIFRAFADETRLRILSLLSRGEMCVGDLVTVLDLPQPTVSRHLSYLRHAALVDTRKDGLWRFYRLAQVDNALQERLFDCFGSCFTDIPVLKSDAGRAKELEKNGKSCCPNLVRRS